MEKGDLVEEMRALTADFSRAHDAALEILEALAEVDGEEAENEAVRINKKTNNCLATYSKTLQLAREYLWAKFAEPEIQLHAEGTEDQCKEVEAACGEVTLAQEFEVLHEGLLDRIHEFEKRVSAWERIISDKVTPYKQLLYKLKNRALD